MPNELFEEISFYVIAHADDWQIFMQPNAFNDLVSNNSKVVFIVTTAGDAGMGKTYWMAREEGLKSSVRFCLAPFGSVFEFNGSKQLNNHLISYWSVNQASCYFLRLPDGGLDGNGFSIHGQKSLSKFEEKKIPTLDAVDNSTSYNGWEDFNSTLQSIILHESDNLSNIWINYLNPDTTLNQNDHPDHVATGQAVQAMNIIKDLRQALFIGYSVSNISADLPQQDLFWKAGMLAAYEKAVFDGTGYSTLRENISLYRRWCLSNAAFITFNQEVSLLTVK